MTEEKFDEIVDKKIGYMLKSIKENYNTEPEMVEAFITYTVKKMVERSKVLGALVITPNIEAQMNKIMSRRAE